MNNTENEHRTSIYIHKCASSGYRFGQLLHCLLLCVCACVFSFVSSYFDAFCCGLGKHLTEAISIKLHMFRWNSESNFFFFKIFLSLLLEHGSSCMFIAICVYMCVWIGFDLFLLFSFLSFYIHWFNSIFTHLICLLI